MEYNQATKKFAIVFPNQQKFPEARLLVTPNLGHRMGFGFFREIARDDKPEEIDDVPKDLEAKKMSVILCNDTAMILICDDSNIGTLMTQSKYSTKCLVALFSTENGTMVSHIGANTLTTRILDRMGTLPNGKLPLKFPLFRFFMDKDMEPFLWNVGARLHGYLRGSKN